MKHVAAPLKSLLGGASRHFQLLLLLIFVFALSAGCRERRDPAESAQTPGSAAAVPRVPLSGNILANSGFEDGTFGWTIPESKHWAGFEIAGTNAHSGYRSAFLEVRADASSPKTRIWGVSQYVNPTSFPHRLNGWYLVQQWEKESPLQYLQVVIIVWGPYPERSFPNYQVRYLLGGVDRQPHFMGNVRYVFLETREPKVGEWTYFEARPAEDFNRLWKRIPGEYDNLQIFFEARFDGRDDPQAAARGDVYFDDLYFGE